MGDRERRATEARAVEDALQPAHRGGCSGAGGDEEEDLVGGSQVDERVGIRQRRREGLLAEARKAGLEDRAIHRAVERRRRQVEDRVQRLAGEHLRHRAVRPRAGRPLRDRRCDAPGRGGVRIRHGPDRHAISARRDPRQIVAMRDVPAADDPDPEPVAHLSRSRRWPRGPPRGGAARRRRRTGTHRARTPPRSGATRSRCGTRSAARPNQACS